MSVYKEYLTDTYKLQINVYILELCEDLNEIRVIVILPRAVASVL